MNNNYYDQELASAYRKIVMVGLAIIVALVVAGALSSCTTTKYVPVESNHTEHHWHTDSVHQVDSFYHEKETTIMQLDSAAMAKYGIQLKNAERAWLVKSWELERQIEALQRLTAERDTVRDSIHVPYPVERSLSKWETVKMDYGGEAIIVVFFIIIIVLGMFIKRLRR